MHVQSVCRSLYLCIIYINDSPHVPKMNRFFLNITRTCFPGKQHIHKNLFRLTWINLDSYTLSQVVVDSFAVVLWIILDAF